jgi:hypothetical protein
MKIFLLYLILLNGTVHRLRKSRFVAPWSSRAPVSCLLPSSRRARCSDRFPDHPNCRDDSVVVLMSVIDTL